jgi:hypothetical protein
VGTAVSRLCIAKQNSRGPPSSAALRPLSLRSAVQARSARRQVIAVKATMGAADSTKGHHHGDRSRQYRFRPCALLITDRSRPCGVRAADRVQRELDDNEDAQKRSQKEQDGSEIRSVELERLVAEGLTLVERRNSMELFRDLAADSSSATPAHPGGRARARWSTIAR